LVIVNDMAGRHSECAGATEGGTAVLWRLIRVEGRSVITHLSTAAQYARRSSTDRGYAAGLYREGTRKFAYIQSYRNGLSGRTLEFKAARTGFIQGMIFMADRLLKVVCLAALVVFPVHSQNLSVPDHVVAITTNLQFITEDDVDQRTKLDLLLEQKQIDREGVIRELSMDIFKIAKAEGAGLLSDALVDKAFADMCLRLGVAPADLTKTLEEKGIRLDTLRKRLRSDVARERLARMPSHGYEDRLDHPLIPKM
jgi:hypothetical protein